MSTDRAGSIGAEATRLLEALQEWSRATFGQGAALGAHVATGAPECAWCPICQFIAVLRGDRPEISQKLTDAGAAVLAAARALVDVVSHPETQPKPPRVQRIDLGDG
jgi:hypothetical protein